MKKKNAVVSLVALASLFCVGGGFALGANTTVSANDTKQQIMLGASILVVNEQTDSDDDKNGIRFPVVVADSVAEKITQSYTYVLPADKWTGAEAPTADEIKAHASTVANDTTDKWVNYYESNTGYGDDYEEAVVYIYNIPNTQFATDFYVCSWMKLNDNTEETSDVVCRSMQYVAVAAVESGAYEATELNKYLTETTYTVNHYLRTIYGNYVLTGEPTTVESYVGFTATGDEVDGYTYNASLTKEANASVTVAADGATTVNCYYENNAYAFKKTHLNNGTGDTTVLTKEGVSIISEVADLAESDYRGNVIKYHTTTDASTGITQTLAFNAVANAGKYIIFNAYFTDSGSDGLTQSTGFMAWGTDSSTSPTSLNAKGIYNQNGKLYSGVEVYGTAVVGKWVSFAHYLDPVYYTTETDNFMITFAMYNNCTAYIGEYVVISEEQYKANFETDNEVVPTGVTKYSGTALVNTLVQFKTSMKNFVNGYKYFTSTGNKYRENASFQISGMTSWTAGQYVAVETYSYTKTGQRLNMFNGSLSAVYDESGNKISSSALKAGEWYTYLFNVPSDVTISQYQGSFWLETNNEASISFAFRNVYVMKDEVATIAWLNAKNYDTSTTIVLSSLALTGANSNKATWAQTTLDGEAVYKYTIPTGAGLQDATLKFSHTPTFGSQTYYVVVEIYWDRSDTTNPDYYGTNQAVDQNRTKFTYYDMNGVEMTKTNKTWMQGVVKLNNSFTVHYLNLGYWAGGEGAEYVRSVRIIDQAEYDATFGTQA